jgi:hypothetical protein
MLSCHKFTRPQLYYYYYYCYYYYYLNMASFSDVSTSRWAMSHANFGNSLGIFYQNVRGLRTKQTELYDNVCASNFDIICLSETWLNDLCYDHNLFPNRYTVYRSDRPCINKARGGGVLTAITASLGSCSCSAASVFGLRFPLLMA